MISSPPLRWGSFHSTRMRDEVTRTTRSWRGLEGAQEGTRGTVPTCRANFMLSDEGDLNVGCQGHDGALRGSSNAMAKPIIRPQA